MTADGARPEPDDTADPFLRETLHELDSVVKAQVTVRTSIHEISSFELFQEAANSSFAVGEALRSSNAYRSMLAAQEAAREALHMVDALNAEVAYKSILAAKEAAEAASRPATELAPLLASGSAPELTILVHLEGTVEKLGALLDLASQQIGASAAVAGATVRTLERQAHQTAALRQDLVDARMAWLRSERALRMVTGGLVLLAVALVVAPFSYEPRLHLDLAAGALRWLWKQVSQQPQLIHRAL